MKEKGYLAIFVSKAFEVFCYSCSNPDQLSFDWKSLQTDSYLVLKKKRIGDVNPISSGWVSTTENPKLKIITKTTP